MQELTLEELQARCLEMMCRSPENKELVKRAASLISKLLEVEQVPIWAGTAAFVFLMEATRVHAELEANKGMEAAGGHTN